MSAIAAVIYYIFPLKEYVSSCLSFPSHSLLGIPILITYLIGPAHILNESDVAPASEVSALKALQDILHNRIIQKKGEIHECQNRAYTDNLWGEIETLHWVSAQILTLKREYTTLKQKEFKQMEQDLIRMNR